MATIKQIDANRRNAQSSTGPTTPEGKQAAARNALKSGIYAESEVLFTERREDLEALTAEYHDRFLPTTPEARDLVDSLIRSSWLLRRLAAAEATIFNCNPNREPDDLRFYNRLAGCLDGLNALQRRINATERNYHRALKALQLLPQPPQPIDPKPTSENLASFPQTPPTVTQSPAQDPTSSPSPSSVIPPPPHKKNHNVFLIRS